ncbi:hypothetical protein ACHQM5_013033 [Ranunculus cassubicifolius]
MECAAEGSVNTRCIGPATRQCNQCSAIAYCSQSHQISHWSVHKEECERLGQQMRSADALHDFPFTFSAEATTKISKKEMTRCSFFTKRNLHQVGMWKYECKCGAFDSLVSSRMYNDWSLPNGSCPCYEPVNSISMPLTSWKDYYEWRCLPLFSPVALLLHWPLTLYHAVQFARSRLISSVSDKLHIHYLGPEKELHQLAVFAELQALFPGVDVYIEFIGPAIPKSRDGEMICMCSYSHCLEESCICKSEKRSGVMLKLRRGFYHDVYREITKVPDLVFAANAGIAAYSTWSRTIELLKDMDVAAVFTDYCEEAAHLAASCISTVTGHPLSIPIQLNPFRQPMVVEESALFLPCYSNCFLFGM